MIRYILKLFTLPIVLPFVVGSIAAQVWQKNYCNEKRLEKLMVKCGRLVLPEHLDLRTGTLILDRPSFSWAVTRLWWTHDRVEELTPFPYPIPQEKIKQDDVTWHPFDRWCTETYLDEKNGKGFLVRARSGKTLLDDLKKKMPETRVVYCESSGKEWEEWHEQSKSNRKGTQLNKPD